MRTITFITATLLAAAVAGCGSLQPTTPVSTTSGPAQRVAVALQHWPAPAEGGPAIKRPFFATIHAMGRRTTATGIMQYYGPRDFRITAATELGNVLFDGRVNWAGVTVLRHMPGLNSMIVEQLLRDLTRAFELPRDLNGLVMEPNSLVLKKTLADTHKYTWTFSPSGLLRSTDIELGAFDTLHADFRSYNGMGWPEDLQVTRKARMFDVSFSFTDNNVVQGEWRGNNHQ
jgi:hypothetical protein